VRPDQLLERGDFLGLRPPGAVDEHVGAVREPVRAGDVARGAWTERRQWIVAEHLAGVEPLLAARAQHHRSVLGLTHYG
jgi:hypothetical protein